ncbi:uncharacterized protein LOC113216895 [Frankliniella occidentalis]|uniref:Uncharacterized protein LOC113216895 n=1 Tax=Frankliniella occidentalis TaxID=133901 RepID=A0A9C6TTB2_FRAOC|nr:uncharacterized protein LOC113216895 [Frankliniella occidentalis]
MASKLTLLFVAVALACLGVAIAAPQNEKLNAYSYGCSSISLKYLRDQIQICTRNLPSQRFFNPGQLCSTEVSGALRGGSSCPMDEAPALLSECLEGYSLDGASSHACLKTAIDNGSCC